MDIVSSFVNLLALKKTDAKPTKEYTYGFGKLEAIASMFQGLFLMGIVVSLIYIAIQKILHGSDLYHLDLGIGVMMFSLSITIILVIYLKKIAKEENSLILKAESLHYETDIYTNIGIIISILIIKFFGWDIIDPILSLVVAVYIGISAILLMKESIQMLMDKSVGKTVLKTITTIIKVHENKDLHDFHMLRTRRSGARMIIDFHLVFRKNISLFDAHKLSDHIEKDILKKYPEADILIHMDPFDDQKIEIERKPI